MFDFKDEIFKEELTTKQNDSVIDQLTNSLENLSNTRSQNSGDYMYENGNDGCKGKLQQVKVWSFINNLNGNNNKFNKDHSNFKTRITGNNSNRDDSNNQKYPRKAYKLHKMFDGLPLYQENTATELEISTFLIV